MIWTGRHLSIFLQRRNNFACLKITDSFLAVSHTRKKVTLHLYLRGLLHLFATLFKKQAVAYSLKLPGTLAFGLHIAVEPYKLGVYL